MTIYPHRIRLRGPWDLQPLDDPNAPWRTVTMPCTPLAAGVAGAVRWRRRFGYPGRLDAFERVWLTFAESWTADAVVVNGQPLGPLAGAGEFNITSLLRERNELLVEARCEDPDPTNGEVALEVRCAAHLEGLSVEITRVADAARLTVSGQVVGAADGLLELYAVLDRRSIAYSVATPGAFRLVAEGLPPSLWRPRTADGEPAPILRVDLVHGASIWYRWQTEARLPTGGAFDGASV